MLKEKTVFEAVIELAFKIPPPNEITPQIVERVQRMESDSRETVGFLLWAYEQIENSCPHVLTETRQGRDLELHVKEYRNFLAKGKIQ